jgi:acyl-ACP thioesterase
MEEAFYIKINQSTSSLKRLKDTILKHIRLQISTDKVKIYNYKGIEIDNADIPYLKDEQTLYLALSSIIVYL